MIWAITRYRAAWMGLILLVIASAARGQGGQKYTIALNFRQGQKIDFVANQKMTQNSTITASGGGVPPQQLNQEFDEVRKGTMEILSVQGGHATSVRIHFDESSSNTTTQNTNTSQQSFPLAGKTVTLKVGDDGKVGSSDDIDALTMSELTEYIQPSQTLYPHNPVAVGEEWQPDLAAMGKEFQLGPNDRADVKCKLLKIGQVGNRRTADINIVGQISKDADGVIIKITLNGVGKLDLQTGSALQADIVGKMAISGTQTQNDPQGRPATITVTGDGNLETHETHTLTDMAGGGGADYAPAPAPGPGPVVNPLDPTGGGGASPFVGQFKNDRLTVVMRPSGNQLAGSIAMGSNSFPAVAVEKGDTLVGSFTSGTDKFEFTATVSGNTMTFKTGSTTYALTRQSVNPLDAGGGGPANPLSP